MRNIVVVVVQPDHWDTQSCSCVVEAVVELEQY